MHWIPWFGRGDMLANGDSAEGALICAIVVCEAALQKVHPTAAIPFPSHLRTRSIAGWPFLFGCTTKDIEKPDTLW